MNTGINSSRSHRIWKVPNFSVWGSIAWDMVEYLSVESVGAGLDLMYGMAPINGTVQSVAFDTLYDHRGIQLPATIQAAAVIVQPKSSQKISLVNDVTNVGFSIARDSSDADPATVDLLIIEMGQ